MESNRNNLLNANLNVNLTQPVRMPKEISTTITITDKILLSNLLNMVKIICKSSQALLIRMTHDCLYFYADDDCEEKIIHCISLENKEITVTCRDSFCIMVTNYFKQGLAHFLSTEPILKMIIENDDLTLSSEDSQFFQKFDKYCHGFAIYKNPETNFTFKIPSLNLENVLCNKEDSAPVAFYFFDKNQTLFEFGRSKNLIRNDMFGIDVDAERFRDLCDKINRKNKWEFKPNEALCIGFKLDRSFLHFFSAVPNIFKKKAKKEKNEDKDWRLYGNNKALQYGDMIYFKLKESRINREDEGPCVIPGEVSMSAIRKHNGQILEQFFFVSDTDVFVSKSKDRFKDDENSYKQLKKDYIQSSVDIDSSGLLLLGTSQNIPKDFNKSVIASNQTSNINKSNMNKGLLNQVKLEHDHSSNVSVNNSKISYSQSSTDNLNFHKPSLIIVPIDESIEQINMDDMLEAYISQLCDSEHKNDNILIENLITNLKPCNNIIQTINNNQNNQKNFSVNNNKIIAQNKMINDSICLPATNDIMVNNNPPTQFSISLNQSYIPKNENSFCSDPNSIENLLKNSNPNNLVNIEPNCELKPFTVPSTNAPIRPKIPNPFLRTRNLDDPNPGSNQNQNMKKEDPEDFSKLFIKKK